MMEFASSQNTAASSLDTLADRIDGIMKESVFDKTEEFAPQDDIDRLISPENRDAIISALGLSQDLQIVDEYILKNAKRLFANSIHGSDFEREDLLPAMMLLKENGLTDNDLPIEYETLITRLSGAIWTRTKIRKFCKSQEEFLAPVFSLDKENHNLRQTSILPFTTKPKKFVSGSFGCVSGWGIHKSHLVNPSDQEFQCPQVVAVKKILHQNHVTRRTVDAAWLKEVKVLREMNELNQPHIVHFFTAFRRGTGISREHYLLLEWANGGNLRNLWETLERPELTANLVRATVSQLQGLADAIDGAHYPGGGGKLNYRHGDLKPENILWFTDEKSSSIGTLKIGDWGLAKKQRDVTELRVNSTTSPPGTRRYESPEEFTIEGQELLGAPSGGKRRSRLYDTWAMGCIGLEFLIWLAYGPEELRTFNQSFKGPFYAFKDGRKTAVVQEKVIETMQRMAVDPAFQVGETALGDLLELIRDHLLVVKLPQQFATFEDIAGSNKSPSRPLPLRPSPPVSSFDPQTGQPAYPSPPPAITFTEADPGPTALEKHVTERLPLDRQFLKTPGLGRAHARRFQNLMEFISTNDDPGDYWFTKQPVGLSDSSANNDNLVNQGLIGNANQVANQYLAPDRNFMSFQVRTELHDYGNTKLRNDWDVCPDSEIVRRLMRSGDSYAVAYPNIITTTKLCGKCQSAQKELCEKPFSITYKWKYLEGSEVTHNNCDLCAFFWQFHNNRRRSPAVHVTFQRDESLIRMDDCSVPLMSIYGGSESKTSLGGSVPQIPRLPAVDNEMLFNTIRQWLKHCDSRHNYCRCDPQQSYSRSSDTTGYLPTRVISVGKEGDDRVRLLETKPWDRGEWTALSHQWGTGRQFCTTVSNKKDRIEMSLDKLPPTFKDAVKVTRAIGCPYLWIDSICIVQGPEGDFNEQAKRMEQVYSGAYCVLAASRSPGHYAGFLGPRKEIETISLRKDRASDPYYISKMIDDFNGHVLEGNLSKRGWVLQEHALARRTIYFTDHQTYFECGDGVRCESLMKMTNPAASFLGDPNFPQGIMNQAGRGEKILHFQKLYQDYSRLGLTLPADRPVAIAGLQERILNALDARGGFGVFDEEKPEQDGHSRGRGLLRRSLLWCRGTDIATLQPIEFPPDHAIPKVPSWSWMAFSGGIDYVSPEFGNVDWKAIQSPWFPEIRGDDTSLIIEASDYHVEGCQEGQCQIVLDDEKLQAEVGKCVVLGTEKPEKGTSLSSSAGRKHFVLVIREKVQNSEGHGIYERIGAGYMFGRCLGPGRVSVEIQ